MSTNISDVELITMRLIDMHWTHPSQDNSRVCSKCGQRVGIYPSSIAALKKCPQAVIICSHCVDPSVPGFSISAGSMTEIIQESKDSSAVRRA